MTNIKGVKNLIIQYSWSAKFAVSNKKALQSLMAAKALYNNLLNERQKRLMRKEYEEIEKKIKAIKSETKVNPKDIKEILSVLADVLYNINFLNTEYKKRSKFVEDDKAKERLFEIYVEDVDAEISKIESLLKSKILSKGEIRGYKKELIDLKTQKKIQDDLLQDYLNQEEFKAGFLLGYARKLKYNIGVARGILEVLDRDDIDPFVEEYIRKNDEKEVGNVLSLNVKNWGEREGRFIEWFYNICTMRQKVNPKSHDIIGDMIREELNQLLKIYKDYLTYKTSSYIKLADEKFGYIYGMLITLKIDELNTTIPKNTYPVISDIFNKAIFPSTWDNLTYNQFEKEIGKLNTEIKEESPIRTFPEKRRKIKKPEEIIEEFKTIKERSTKQFPKHLISSYKEDGMEVNPLGVRGGATTPPQSIRFDRDYWTKLQAKRWLRTHGFKQTILEMENWWAARQYDPKRPPFKVRGYRYAVAGKGIQQLAREGIKFLVGIRKGARRLNPREKKEIFERLIELLTEVRVEEDLEKKRLLLNGLVELHDSSLTVEEYDEFAKLYPRQYRKIKELIEEIKPMPKRNPRLGMKVQTAEDKYYDWRVKNFKEDDMIKLKERGDSLTRRRRFLRNPVVNEKNIVVGESVRIIEGGEKVLGDGIVHKVLSDGYLVGFRDGQIMKFPEKAVILIRGHEWLKPPSKRKLNPVSKLDFHDGKIIKIKKIIDTRKNKRYSYPVPKRKELNDNNYILDTFRRLFNQELDIIGVAHIHDGIMYFGEETDFYCPICRTDVPQMDRSKHEAKR